MVTKRTYTETEKIGTMLLALRHGVAEAVNAVGVPERTVYQWFEDSGGIAAVRKFADNASGFTIATAAQAVAMEVQRRAEAGNLPADELLETYRALLPKEAPLSATTQAGAQANAAIHLHIGEEELILPAEQ